MNGYKVPSLLVAVEQAIARGETTEDICAALYIGPDVVARVQKRMDAALAEDDQPAAKPHVRTAPVAPCGTRAAYERHLRRRESVDEACRAAARNRWRASRRSAA